MSGEPWAGSIVRWSRQHTGYLQLIHPDTGESCEIAGKGAPRWMLDRAFAAMAMAKERARHADPERRTSR